MAHITNNTAIPYRIVDFDVAVTGMDFLTRGAKLFAAAGVW